VIELRLSWCGDELSSISQLKTSIQVQELKTPQYKSFASPILRVSEKVIMSHELEPKVSFADRYNKNISIPCHSGIIICQYIICR
jgi:hypothetical protein